MVTGDHKETACAIGRDVGLFGPGDIALDQSVLDGGGYGATANESEVERAAVFSRVKPQTKYDLVDFFQKHNAVVAMTGYGINDAPALRKADVGIAMGRRGTEVAREAADIVLRDDAFGSIVAAMRQGRITFANIRIFVAYLLSCNLSEIAVIAVATLSGMPLPLLPLQILFLNLVTDVFPAFALGLGEGESDVMARPPRDPQEPLISRRTWTGIALHGAILTTFTLAAFGAARQWGMSDGEAVTIAFIALGLGQLLHVFNMRGPRSHAWRNQIVANRYVWTAVAGCAALIVAVVEIGPVAEVIGNRDISLAGWGLALLGALGPLVVIQTGLAIQAVFDTRQGGRAAMARR